MGSEQQQVLIRFEGLTTAQANQAATELRNQIRRATGSQVTVDVIKENPETQDFGSTLAVVLGTPFAVALAKGISDFISKSGSRVVVETPEGKVIARGDAATNIDIDRTVAALKDPQSWAKA